MIVPSSARVISTPGWSVWKSASTVAPTTSKTRAHADGTFVDELDQVELLQFAHVVADVAHVFADLLGDFGGAGGPFGQDQERSGARRMGDYRGEGRLHRGGGCLGGGH